MSIRLRRSELSTPGSSQKMIEKAASSAEIMLEPDSTYITPFTTIGVTSGFEGLGGFERFDGVRGSTRVRFHAGCSLPTLSALICFSGLNRFPE